jgi:uncharacterized tellurite resistance protein B-like protein
MTGESSGSDQLGGTFATELIKLLLQVAWADHDVAPAEAQALLDYARRQGLSHSELKQLTAMLNGSAPLTPPNLGLLKQHRTQVMRAIRELLLSDLAVSADETEVLEQLSVLLR